MIGASVWGSRTSDAFDFAPQLAQVSTWPTSLRRTMKVSPQAQGAAWAPAGISTGGFGFGVTFVFRGTFVTRVRPFFPPPKKSVVDRSDLLFTCVVPFDGFVTTVRSFSPPRCTIGFVGTMIADLVPPESLKTTWYSRFQTGQDCMLVSSPVSSTGKS